MFDLEKQRALLIDYFKSGEKSKDNLKLGVEFEHFVIDRKTGRTLTYFDPKGVKESLEDLLDESWEGYYNDDYLLGMEKKPFTISTEPAAQFEISIDAQKSLKKMEDLYLEFMDMVLPYFHKKDQDLVTLGYHPVTKIDEIKISPKKRYGYMYEYFKNKGGTHAHNMMKGTAAVQVVIDYENEEDFILKYRLGSAISPILYTIFDNALIFEGEELKTYNIRQKIWEHTDRHRSGLVNSAFDEDFSYKKYADYILNNNIIFTDKDGKLASTGDKLFKDIFDPEKATKEEIFHALSIVFPDLRLKSYLEFRMMDAVPYPLNFAAVALIKGLMYSEENLDILEKDFKDINLDKVQEAKKACSIESIRANYLDKTILEWGKYLLGLAEKGLEEEEKAYLNPLKDLLEKAMTPRDKFKKIKEEKGLLEAIRESRIDVDNV